MTTMKKILLVLVALFAINIAADAQSQKVEYRFGGGSKEMLEGSMNTYYEEWNPYILKRINGGDWFKLSDDRVVISGSRTGVDAKSNYCLHVKNYSKHTVRFLIKYKYDMYKVNNKTKSLDMHRPNQRGSKEIVVQGRGNPNGSWSIAEPLFWFNQAAGLRIKFYIEFVKIIKVEEKK